MSVLIQPQSVKEDSCSYIVAMVILQQNLFHLVLEPLDIVFKELHIAAFAVKNDCVESEHIMIFSVSVSASIWVSLALTSSLSSSRCAPR